jgi:membrane-bound serine protease (ClpP class)
MFRRVPVWLVSLSLLMLGLWAHLAGAQAPTSSQRPVVYVLPIEGVIDLGLAPFVARVLKEAEAAGAAAVILEIDTFGGRVDAAVQIRDALLESPLRTVAFVNKRAISAGALIALASETVIMAAGSTIGAAAPVQAGAPGAAAQPVQEKTVSYVRKEFGATAEARNRPQALAEAMVDADVEVAGVIEKGKLLTLTTEEALKQKVADLRADSIEAVLEALDLTGAELRPASPHWAEQLVRLLTHPVLSSALISIGLVGILVELRTPGFGFAGGVGIGSLALFFYGHWLVQLAGWEELLLVAAGLVLLALEIFVLPGFGISGALGIIALLGAFALTVTGPGDTAAVIVSSVTRIFIALAVGLLASLALMRVVPSLPFARRLVLQTDLGHGPSHGSAPETDLRWLGKRGVAASQLRPAGIAELEGERVDVVADGVLIEAGEHIEVTRVDGNRIVVRRVHTATQEERT